MEYEASCSIFQLGFVNNPTKSTLYIRKYGETYSMLYADGLLIRGPNDQGIANLKLHPSILPPQHSVHHSSGGHFIVSMKVHLEAPTEIRV